jgi:hypothetical protein
LASPLSAGGGEDNVSIENSGQQTIEFAYGPKWLKAIHYDPKILYGYKSAVDGTGFFLSETGKTNPLSELKANLNSYAVDPSFICRFPFRGLILSEFLGRSVPDFGNCREFMDWKNRINAKSVRAVLASSFPESPPSMFGHLFLQFSNESAAVDSTNILNSGLINYGVNFSAIIPEGAGIEMAYKGMFGGYEGHFSIVPYHQMLAQYSHVEERDLWTYELNFSDEETAALLAHLWEIETNHGYFAYFFLDENCSYQILRLLGAVRYQSNLLPGPNVYHLPIEAIPALTREHFFTGRQMVRRAPSYDLVRKLEALTADERQQVDRIIDGTEVIETQKQNVLDAAILKLTVQKQTFRGDSLDFKRIALLKKLTIARSKLGAPQSSMRLAQEHDMWDRPELAHKSMYSDASLMAVESNRDGDRNSFNGIGFGFKPALHDRMARGPGFGKGMHLDVLNARFQILQKKENSSETLVRAQSLQLIDIGVLQPVNLDRPSPSWLIKSQLESIYPNDPVRFVLDGRTGGGVQILSRLLGFSMIGFQVEREDEAAGVAPLLNFGLLSADAIAKENLFPLTFRTEWTVLRRTHPGLSTRGAEIVREFDAEAGAVFGSGENSQLRVFYHQFESDLSVLKRSYGMRVGQYF